MISLQTWVSQASGMARHISLCMCSHSLYFWTASSLVGTFSVMMWYPLTDHEARAFSW
jgi:hypothetical protein